jgi:hypothetical protein
MTPDPRATGSPERPVAYPGLYGQSWLSKSELDWMIGLLPQAGLLIECGTASGVTAARVADARPNLTVVCVDNFVDHDAPFVQGHDRCRVDTWRRNARPNMRLWMGDLASLAAFRDHGVDYRYQPGGGLMAAAILVDADHTSPGVDRDLILAQRLVAPGGTVFVHDVDEPNWPDVGATVDRVFAPDGPWARLGQHWTMLALRRPG